MRPKDKRPSEDFGLGAVVGAINEGGEFGVGDREGIDRKLRKGDSTDRAFAIRGKAAFVRLSPSGSFHPEARHSPSLYRWLNGRRRRCDPLHPKHTIGSLRGEKRARSKMISHQSSYKTGAHSRRNVLTVRPGTTNRRPS